MNVASIDIGTNTVLLLIAEVNLSTKSINPVLNIYEMPRIGRGIKESRRINPESVSKLFAVLRGFKTAIMEFNCGIVFVSGTNAFRMAANSNEITESIRSEFGFDVKVISGEEEAEFAYLGATSAIKEMKPLSVIDIGGSSTEIITGESSRILTKVSLQIGSVISTEEFLKTSPPEKFGIEKLKQEVVNQFEKLDKNLVTNKVIAIAGTATTLACMILQLKDFDEERVNNFNLKYNNLTQLITYISKIGSAEIIEKYGNVMKGREDIILAGAIILEQFMEYYKVDSLIVSTRGIRYGAIVKQLFNNTMGVNSG